MKQKFIIVLILNISLLAAQLFLSSTRSSDGETIYQINKQLSELTRENSRMENKVYELTATSRLLEYADSNNFQPAKITFLKSLTVADLSSTWNGE